MSDPAQLLRAERSDISSSRLDGPPAEIRAIRRVGAAAVGAPATLCDQRHARMCSPTGMEGPPCLAATWTSYDGDSLPCDAVGPQRDLSYCPGKMVECGEAWA